MRIRSFTITLVSLCIGSGAWAAQVPGGDTDPINPATVSTELPAMRKHFQGDGQGATQAAAWQSLGQLKRLIEAGQSALPQVLESFQDRSTPKGMRVLLAREVLSKIADQHSLSSLANLIHDKTEPPAIRGAAIRVVGAIGGKEALRIIIPVAEDNSEDQLMQVSVIRALGAIGDKEGAPILAKRLKKGNSFVRVVAARALHSVTIKTGDKAVLDPLVGLLEDSGFEHRNVAMQLLGKSKHRKAIPAMKKALQDKKEDYVVRCAAADALGNIGGDEAVEALLPLLEDKDELVRGHVATAVSKAGARADKVPRLERALQATKDEFIRERIRSAIKHARTK